MKFLFLYEELSSEIPNSVDYTIEKSNDYIVYKFSYKGYRFLVSFTKLKKLEFSEWERCFETYESEFETLNISNTSSLKIYGIVTRITNDFINDTKPDVIVMTHITSSRFRINRIFLQKFEINGYKKFYTEYDFGRANIHYKSYIIKNRKLKKYKETLERELKSI